MKKGIIIILVFFVIFASLLNPQMCVIAETKETTSVETKLEEAVVTQLDDLNFSSIESVLYEINDDSHSLFGGTTFFGKVKQIISGDIGSQNKNLFRSVFDLFFDNILNFLPILTSVVAIAIICSFMTSLRSQTNGKSVADIVHFACYGVVVVIIASAVVQMVGTASGALNSIKNQMESIFPILLTMLTAIGGTVSVSVFSPSIAMLCGTVIGLFTNFVLPIFLFCLVFSVVSNLNMTVKLNKFTDFFNSLFKYVVGFIFTIFTAFMSVQGLTASSVDTVSIKTAKFALRSYVPLVGGYFSEGFSVIMASSSLIKNAVGASGLILLFATIIVPVVKIVVFTLMLKLTAAIIEPIGDSRISGFIHSVAKPMTMLVVMLLAVSFMYLISVGIIMCTANLVG